MRPDPLDKVKPDNPVYLIGSAVGWLVSLSGTALAAAGLSGARIGYSQRGQGVDFRILSSGEVVAMGGVLLLIGVAIIAAARIWRGSANPSDAE